MFSYEPSKCSECGVMIDRAHNKKTCSEECRHARRMRLQAVRLGYTSGYERRRKRKLARRRKAAKR